MLLFINAKILLQSQTGQNSVKKFMVNASKYLKFLYLFIFAVDYSDRADIGKYGDKYGIYGSHERV